METTLDPLEPERQRVIDLAREEVEVIGRVVWKGGRV